MKRVLTFGVFDYFHLGHLRLFKQCKEYGDYLIVAVQDGDYIKKYKPNAKVLYSTSERIEMISALRVVNKVCVYQEIGQQTIQQINDKIGFDILALGEDHREERFKMMEHWCLENGKDVVRLKRTPGICSSDIKAEFANTCSAK